MRIAGMSAPEGAESCGPRRQPWDNRRGCSSPGRGDRRSTYCSRRNSVAPTGLAGNPTPRPTACAVGQSLARLRRSLWWKVPSLCRFMNNPGEAVPKWAAVISSTTLPKAVAQRQRSDKKSHGLARTCPNATVQRALRLRLCPSTSLPSTALRAGRTSLGRSLSRAQSRGQ